MRRAFALVAAGLLMAWGTLLAYLVAENVFGTFHFAPYTPRWSTVPAVWVAELALVVCIFVIGAVLARRVGAASSSSGRVVTLAGVGLLAFGALSVLVGVVGMRVPTPRGSNDLERGEVLFELGGAVQLLLGFALTLPRLLSAAIAPRG
jgi:hypothetical protein